MNKSIKYLVLLIPFWVVDRLPAQGIRDSVVKIRTIEALGIINNTEKPVENTDMGFDQENKAGKKLSEILQENTSSYIKNYGAGQLSSISVNGSSAAQVSVLWDGIKINNPGTGQVDLALFDVGTADNVHLNNLASNQSVGGNLLLNNRHNFLSDTLISENTIRYGSFNTLNLSSSNYYTIGNFNASTRISYLRSDNDFPFFNFTQIGAPVQREANAVTSLLSFLQLLEVRLKRDFRIGADFWATSADRQIPPILTNPVAFERQWDNAYRGMAYFNGRKGNYLFSFKSAFLYDWLRFIDPISETNSLSTAEAFRNLFSISYYPYRYLQLLGIANYDREWASSSGLNNLAIRDIYGLTANATFIFRKFLNAKVSLKQDLLGSKPLPFSPALEFIFTNVLNRNIFKIILSGARAYRLPALNDLYWTAGGNPALKPENAWNSQLSLRWEQASIIKVELSGFYNYISDWILWTPQSNGLWVAQNVKRVLSRGINTGIHAQNKASLSDPGFVIVFYAGYSLTNTISLDAYSLYDNSKDKQLIYVPVHHFTASLQFQFRRLYLRWVNGYTGVRFINTDDSQSLPAYYLCSIEAGKTLNLQKQEVGFSIRCNNLTNTQYQMVSMYPMPGRSFEFTIHLNLTK